MSKFIEFDYVLEDYYNPISEGYERKTLEVQCIVEEELDPYGTGDSPAQLNVKCASIVDKEDNTGKQFDLLGDDRIGYHAKRIERIACDKYRGY